MKKKNFNAKLYLAKNTISNLDTKKVKGGNVELTCDTSCALLCAVTEEQCPDGSVGCNVSVVGEPCVSLNCTLPGFC